MTDKVIRLGEGATILGGQGSHNTVHHGPGELHPDYYQTASGLDPWAVIKMFELDYWRGSMVAYLLRMGRKPGNSELEDMRKVYTFAAERLRQLEEEAYPERHIVGDEHGTVHRGPTDVG
jgi:hypothetical protein